MAQGPGDGLRPYLMMGRAKATEQRGVWDEDKAGAVFGTCSLPQLVSEHPLGRTPHCPGSSDQDSENMCRCRCEGNQEELADV